ncbi:MAG: type II toxin-antitoxin system VapC family toxin [Wenzhouxiangella sp.]|nr:MAG: type II toxin-antitoxin system VapC family toxin [Wenzhouxiangella sp.]
MGFLIDTCIWIDVEQGRLGAGDVASFTGDKPVWLSPVTLAELKFGIEMAKDADVRQRRLATFRRMARKPLLVIDATTGEVFGEIAAYIAGKVGRSPRTRVQDLWLAAQAIQHGLGLLTRNEKDFEGIPGLEVVGVR